jgi:hypothetical protein
MPEGKDSEPTTSGTAALVANTTETVVVHRDGFRWTISPSWGI